MRDLPNLENERIRLAEVDRLTAELESGSDPVLNSVVSMVSAHFGVPTALVSVIDRDYQIFKARVGFEVERTAREMSFCAHDLDKEPVLEICDSTTDPRFSDNPLVCGSPFIRYYAGAPLITQPGLSLGRLCIIDQKARSPMSEQDKTLLRNAATAVVSHLQSIHQQHFVDPITGLPNRNRLEADLESVEVSDGRIACLVEPLSAAGMDRLVKALGLDFFTSFMLAIKEVLLGVLPQGTRLYRSGTLNFVTLIAPSAAPSLPQLMQRMVAALDAPIDISNVPVFADVGISVLRLGAETDTPTESLRSMASITDAARRSEARWLDYDPVIDSNLRRSTELLYAIETALLATDQLRLVYQPRIDLLDNRCVGVEALLRWTHPTLGEISPAEFIPLAETTASIRNITHWVIKNACAQVAKWSALGMDVPVSLNVSALDLIDGRLFTDLTQALHEFRVAPQSLELEFTESALVTDFYAVQGQLQRFRELGVAISIDDFGSGYSNWIYLRQIPATTVKLDRSLVADLQPGTSEWHIVRGLISLLRDLKLTVIAEGLETELHYHLLRGWGCHQGQGYYFAKPLPPDELIAWLKSGEVFAASPA